MPSETNLKGELVVNQVLDGNGLKISRKKTTVFTDKSSRSMTNIDDKKEHEKMSLQAVSLNSIFQRKRQHNAIVKELNANCLSIGD